MIHYPLAPVATVATIGNCRNAERNASSVFDLILERTENVDKNRRLYIPRPLFVR